MKLLADDLGMTAHRNFYWRFAHNFEDIHSLGHISIASLNVLIKQYRNFQLKAVFNLDGHCVGSSSTKQ